MANEFLEDRLNALVNYGAAYQDEYNVDINETVNDAEYRALNHPFPRRRFNVAYTQNYATLYANLLNVYHRVYGKYAGFRVKCMDDYTSNAETGNPTAFDQPMALISTGVYQLQKVYGGGGSQLATIGLPKRTIFKPVGGTVHVGVGTTEIRAADYSVSSTTGQVTFAADVTTAIAISSVSKAAQCAITYASAPPFVTGQSVNLSGFVGMTQLNGLRSLVSVSGNVVTLTGINSTGFGTWVSGGTLHTRPQSGETVTAGFEFDIPVRFNTTVGARQNEPQAREIEGIELLELLNP